MVSTNRFRASFKAIAALVLVSLTTAACGGDDDDASADVAVEEGDDGVSAATVTDDASASREPASVRVLLTSPSLGYVSFYVAEHEGYFDDEALSIDRQPDLPNAAQAAQAVTTGQTDIALTSAAGVIGVHASQFGGIHHLGRISVGAALELVLSDDAIQKLEAEGVTSSSPIQDRVAALEGLTIGAGEPGTSSDVLMRSTLEIYGLEPDKDVTLLGATRDAALAAFREGKADGILFGPPASSIPVIEGLGDFWIRFQDGEVETYEDIDWAAVGASTELTDETPEVATRFMRALWRGLDFVQTNPDEARSIALEATGLDADGFDVVWESVYETYPDTPLPGEEAFERTYELMSLSNPDLRDVEYEALYPVAIIEDARP